MKKKWSILAGLFFCMQAFLACSESDASSAVINEISEPPTIKVNIPTEEKPSLRTTILGDSSGKLTSSDLYLDYPADSFLTKFQIGDVVTVAVVGYDTLEMPVAESANDVPISWFALKATKGSENLIMTIHYGQMSHILKINGIKTPIDVVITQKDNGGYLLGLETMRYAQRMSSHEESYPNISVEEFANFREVSTTGMGKKKLYRSSSPIDHSLGRNFYADSLAKVADVATFINLANTEDNAKSYGSFDSSYYSSQNAVFLNLPVEFFSSRFKEGLVRGFRYMIDHNGPYLVHCTYGMDRTGFTIAVLEALMGATAEEIQADYAKTFSNYFNIIDGRQIGLNELQVDFFKHVVLRNLRAIYHAEGVDVPNTGNVDWATATENYLGKLGMTQQEIFFLKHRLK